MWLDEEQRIAWQHCIACCGLSARQSIEKAAIASINIATTPCRRSLITISLEDRATRVKRGNGPESPPPDLINFFFQ
jgi:hypothetical protein